MRRSLNCLLYLLSLLSALVGSLLLVRGYMGGAVLPRDLARPAHTPVALIGLILCVLAVLLYLVAWIGASVKTVQLRRWGWFICLCFFSGMTLLLYIFVGPTTSPSVLTPPYKGFGD